MRRGALIFSVLISIFLFNFIQVYGDEEAIAPAKLLLNLSTDLISVSTGNRTSFVAIVENVGGQQIESVKISIEGISSSWVEATPASINISAKNPQNYLVTIDVPVGTEPGVYELMVKASNEVESNIEGLSLVVGENLKEIADILVKQFEDNKNLAEKSLLVEDCIDITIVKVIHKEAEYAYQRGLDEYENENYTETITWFEYAIPVEKNVILSVDKNLEMELDSSKKLKIIIPPFYQSENLLSQAQTYLEEKNYEEVCGPILEIRKRITFGMIFWPIIVIIIIVLIIIFVIFYKRKRIEEKVDTMERIRERLGEPEETI